MKQSITPFLLITVLCITAFTPKPKNETLSYSISLSVKDIQKSYAFYTKLGFKPINGTESLQQQWIVLSNGQAKIGLFQGMFPKNTITFNPNDNRAIYQKLKSNGLEPTNLLNMDKGTGPCTFTLMDPDGNPILFDQHQ